MKGSVISAMVTRLHAVEQILPTCPALRTTTAYRSNTFPSSILASPTITAFSGLRFLVVPRTATRRQEGSTRRILLTGLKLQVYRGRVTWRIRMLRRAVMGQIMRRKSMSIKGLLLFRTFTPTLLVAAKKRLQIQM